MVKWKRLESQLPISQAAAGFIDDAAAASDFAAPRWSDHANRSIGLVKRLHRRRQDSKGRLLWTVTARPVTMEERDAAEDVGLKNRAMLLVAMAKMPGASLAVLAQEVGWVTKDGKPYRSQVQRILNALREDKLAKKDSGRWVLTKKGIQEAREVTIDEEDDPFHMAGAGASGT
jgi:hypothetical protein